MWDFGDGNRSYGKQAVHYYDKPGKYEVKLSFNEGENPKVLTREVFVFSKQIYLVADNSINNGSEDQNRLSFLKNFAEESGVFLQVIEDLQSTTEFLSEEILTKKILESLEDLSQSNEVVIYTEGNIGLNALSRAQQQLKAEDKIDFEEKVIFTISSDPKSSAMLQRSFQLLKPNLIVAVKEASILPIIEGPRISEIFRAFDAGGYIYQIIDAETGQLHFTNFMSYFVNFLVDNGIPDNTVVLVLLVPLIATVIAFMKQVIGIPTFGIYTPTILTLTFWMLGLHFGLVTFLIVLITGALTRLFLKNFRILHVPKVAIVLTMVALTIFAVLTISVALKLFDPKFIAFAIFPLLIMSTLTEKFVSIQSEKGLYYALKATIQTLFLSIVALFFIGGEINLYLIKLKMSFFNDLILRFPETIFVLILVNFFLGKWTGLRLMEYMRFREVIKNIEE
jgi:PKD repeat protein